MEHHSVAHINPHMGHRTGTVIGSCRDLPRLTVNGIVPDGFRVMTLNRKVESLADLKDLKLRIPTLEVMVKIGECLGCAVAP